MRSRKFAALAAAAASSLALTLAQAPAAYGQEDVPEAGPVDEVQRIDELREADNAPTRFIVEYKDDVPTNNPEERVSVLNEATPDALPDVTEVRETEDGSVVTTDRVLSGEEVHQFIQDAMNTGKVEHIEEDVRMYAMGAPNDPQYKQQWHLNGSAGSSIDTAWAKATKQGAGQTIAVIDTGITAHPDLDGNVKGGYDFISEAKDARDGDGWDPNPSDEGDYNDGSSCGGGGQASNSSWHGTHVAGISAALSDNGTGVASVAPKATIQPIRALGPCGGYSSDIIAAINWASGGEVSGAKKNPNPATIINMSLGGQGKCSQSYQKAITDARSRGTVVVVAAGNESQDAANVQPASCDGAITVAASGPRDQKSSYSNYGRPVDVTAPGGDDQQGGGILATYNDGKTRPGQPGYSSLQGTSMATPYVAGVAALIRAENPSMTPDQVAARLRESTRPLKGSCNGCGTGIVDPAKAVGEGGGGGDDGREPGDDGRDPGREPDDGRDPGREPGDDGRDPGRKPGWGDWDWGWDDWFNDDWGWGDDWGFGRWPWKWRW